MKKPIISTLAVLAFAAFASAQAVVDPDPEIFDGTKTKHEAIQQEQDPAKNAMDDWEGANMVVYDANGPQGNGEGGQGGPQGGGMGLDAGGLPIPAMGGGGSGAPGAPGVPPPNAKPGGGPESKQNADTAGAAQSAARPSDVSIGDPSQRIKTTAQGQAGNTPGKPEGGEEGAKKAGEDSTQIPASANTNQSGTRGGGVERGDAMDPDQI